MSTKHTFEEWNRARHWLVPALEDATEDEVLNDLLLNRAQLWRGDGGAIVTQLVAADPPNITVWLGGGDVATLLALRPGIEAWGRQQGAREARINGRTGWARALRDAGFREHDGELVKTL